MRPRECSTCHEVKPRAEYESPRARRCAACTEAARSASVCGVCGVSLPLKAKGQPQRECAAQACRDETRRRAVAAAHAARRAAYAARTELACSWCETVKPWDDDHYSPRQRINGVTTKRDTVCKPCQAAIVRDRYHADPERRRQNLARARARQKEIARRMDADPEYAEQVREQRREWARSARARQDAEPVRFDPGAAVLPGRPLGEFVTLRAQTTPGGMDALAARLQVSHKTVAAWRAGERDVAVGIADAALVALDVLWFDVWDPDKHPEAAAVFDPDEVALAV